MISLSTTIYQQLQDVCETIYSEHKTAEVTTLSRAQQTAILDILKGSNLSTSTPINQLFKKLQEEPRITRIVHLAITSSSDSNSNYRAFEKELTCSFLDHLEKALKIEDSNARADAVENWLKKYCSHFDQKTLELVEPEELYRLTSRLMQCECPELPAYKALLQNLPVAGKNYAALLQLPLSDFWKQNCEVHKEPSKESYQNRYTALAYYIDCKKLPMAKVAEQLPEQELQELMPYLRYGNFKGMESSKAARLLSNCTSLEYVQELFVSHLTIAKLPALPVCTTLDCWNCHELTTLPELNACTTLNYSNCHGLMTLPALPACTYLNCSSCHGLMTLPALPACTELDCSSCYALTALPALPACTTLDCWNCPVLTTLPALPACTTLNCSSCHALTALPALPTCTNLNCTECARLIELPALPACMVIDCSLCTTLSVLPPDLSACTEINCSNCPELTTLPALPACTNFNCTQCARLIELPALPACTAINCSRCTMLSVLPPDLSACTNFNCSFCYQLMVLPTLPACAKLNCSGCSGLPTLPELNACTELKCHGCYALTKLPELPQCTTLKCSVCARLTELPALPACTELDCSQCSGLTTLPELPQCARLICVDCPKLAKLPELNACTNLDCSSCPELMTLPALPACTKLTCSNCPGLTTLPALPACTELHCLGCSELTALPALPACTELDCSQCSGLTTLPELNACTKLTCSNCPGLTTLPALPACTELDCSQCSGLTTLPELNACRHLTCLGCSGLLELPALPACMVINCSDCATLSVLPPALPLCTIFICENCPLLRMRTPELPLFAQIYTGDSTPLQFTKLEVEVSEIASNPKKMLLELGRNYLLQNKHFPNIYYLLQGTPSNAVDIGGVRRDLVSRILEVLFSQTPPSENRLSLDHEQFPELTDQQDADCFRTIGRLLALCYPSHSAFKTGPLFPLEFYKKIALTPWVENLASTPSDENLLATYPHFREWGEISQLTAPAVDLPSVDKAVLQTALYFLDLQESDPQAFFMDPENRRLLRNKIIETAKDDKRFQAAALMAQEMKAALSPIEWNELRSLKGDDLHDRIEGKLDAKSLLLKLQPTKEGSVTDEQKETVVGYLKHWIGQAPIEELRTFVRAVTSNNALGKDSIIQVAIVKRGPAFVPVAHTCFFTIDLSCECPNQETFNDKIKILLKEGMAGDGFQIA